MVLIELERMSRILSKAQFGCLREAYTLNVTRGCEFLCAYCYARGYLEAPLPGEVYLYGNLPEKLAAELDSPRRRAVVDWVQFNTASDSFQSHPKILDVTCETMKVLLERGIGISFSTKGWIPNRFIELFAAYSGLVAPTIGLVSTSPRYRDLFEPHAASVDERLDNISRLKGAGVDVDVRVDPIIPFQTDDVPSIERLYQALTERGIRTISLSYLHLRPAIVNQLRQELPATEFAVIQSCFQSQPWSVVGTSTRSKLIPRSLREKGYGRFLELAKAFGIKAIICSCKNPDLPAQRCPTGNSARKSSTGQGKDGRQLTLFPC